MSVGTEEFDFPLESVKVWYKCAICQFCFYSLPVWKNHAKEAHKIASETIQLPNNIPPGALEGKIYFTYINFDPPPPKKRTILEDVRAAIPVSTESESCAQTYPTRSTANLDKSKSPQDKLYKIRIRNIKDLRGSSSSDENETEDSPMLTNGTGQPLSAFTDGNEARMTASPPDSGIQMHDGSSETQDDEFQTHTVQGENHGKTTDDNASIEHLRPAVSKASVCQHCNKTFRTVSSLNFHVNKFHKDQSESGNKSNTEHCNSQQSQPIPLQTENLKLKLIRDSVTGNFSKASEENVLPSRSHNSTDLSSRSSSISNPIVNSTKPPTNDDNSADSDFAPTKKRKVSVITSSESETTHKKKLRASKALGKSSESVELDSSPSPRPIKTRSRKGRRTISLQEIYSSSSSSSSSSGSSSSDEDDKNEESEGEISQKSTTSADSPPILTDYEDYESKKRRASIESEKNNKNSSSDSDSSDLFIPVIRKVKRTKTNSRKISSVEEVTPQPKQTANVCGTCSIECKSASALVNHMKNDHPTKSVQLVCGYCKQKFKSSNEFNVHIKSCKRKP